MIKIGIYIDGPTIVGRDNVIKFAFLYDTNTFTPTNVVNAAVVIYTFVSLTLTDLLVSGSVITPEVFLNNIDKFTYSGGLSFSGGDLTDNRKLAALDESIPLAFLRANTIVNFGRL